MSYIAIAGSRHLPTSWSGIVGGVVRSVLKSGRGVFTGCAAGADGFAIAACWQCRALDRLVVFAAGGEDLKDFSDASASVLVKAASRAGANVIWYAGGPPSLPIHERLAARTKRMVWATASSGDRAGLVAFVTAGSRGTRLAIRTAIEAGLPVIAFPVTGKLPQFPGGKWVPAATPDSNSIWSLAFRWAPDAQKEVNQ